MKLNRILYKFGIVITSFTLSLGAFAQPARSSYFMKTAYQRTSLNPALRPDQGYIGIPFLSDIYVDAKTNTFNLETLTFPLNGERVTFMHAAIPDQQALANISRNNYITSQLGISLFSMGFFKGDSYWNIDFRARLNIDGNIPKSLFELLKTGFNEDETVTHDLSNMSFRESMFTEIGVAHSRPLFDKNLILGARAKLLFGLSNIDLNAKSLSLTAGSEYWKARSQVSMRGAGPGIVAKYKIDENDPNKKNFDGFDYNGFSIPGYGLGVDVGAEYSFRDSPTDFLKKLKISYSLNDIGFIYWSKNNSAQLSSPATEVVITPNDYTIHGNGGTSIRDIFDDAVDDIKQAINLYETPTNGGYTTALRGNMNTGVEYEFWKDKMTAGLLYSIRFGRYFVSNEFTVSTNYKPNSWFATSLTYSFVYNAYNMVGLAVNIAPSKGVNLFLASDYMIINISPQGIPTTSKAINFQMGISVPMGGKR